MGTGPEVLVLCLGNDLLSDDGVGWAVADALERERLPRGVRVAKSALSGLYLLDELHVADSAVVVDAVRTGASAAGCVLSCDLDDLHTGAGPSPHAVGLPSVLDVARRSGVRVPRSVRLVLVEALDLETVGEGLSEPVRAAVPLAVSAVLEEVRRAAEGAP